MNSIPCKNHYQLNPQNLLLLESPSTIVVENQLVYASVATLNIEGWFCFPFIISFLWFRHI